MNWKSFIAGFICFPIVALLIRLWIAKKSNVEPFQINDSTQLQELVNRLFRKGKHGDILYILDRSTEFIVRIIKMKRKTKDNTLKVEIRASDKNADGYSTVKDFLSKDGIEFEETFTPKLNRPSRMYLKNDNGGVFTVSSMSQVVSRIMTLVNKERRLDVLASDHDPILWNKKRQQN